MDGKAETLKETAESISIVGRVLGAAMGLRLKQARAKSGQTVVLTIHQKEATSGGAGG